MPPNGNLFGQTYTVFDRRRDAHENAQAMLSAARDLRERRAQGYTQAGEGYDSSPSQLVWAIWWSKDDDDR